MTITVRDANEIEHEVYTAEEVDRLVRKTLEDCLSTDHFRSAVESVVDRRARLPHPGDNPSR
jgi:hypothetical protein